MSRITDTVRIGKVPETFDAPDQRDHPKQKPGLKPIFPRTVYAAFEGPLFHYCAVWQGGTIAVTEHPREVLNARLRLCLP